MKKFAAFVLAVVLVCSGCGLLPTETPEPTRTHKKIASPIPTATASPTDSPTPTPTASPTPEPTVTFTLAPTPEPTPEPSPTPEPTERPTLPPPKAEFGQKVYYLWKDDTDTVYISVACEIKNTGTCAIEPDITITVSDKNGDELDTFDMLDVYPDIIPPGKTGYMGYSHSLLDADNTEDVAKVDASISYKATYGTCTYFDASDLKYTLPAQGDTESTVTGDVQNNTQDDADYAMVVCALYDSNGKLIGVFGDTLSDTVYAGKAEPFELSDDLCPSVRNNVSKIVCVACETEG